MNDAEIRDILKKGENQLKKIKFSNLVEHLIVEMSAGYPHFAHLLALKSCEKAIGNEEKIVHKEHLDAAIRQAMQDAEQNLRLSYENAIRAKKHNTAEKLMIALAKCHGTELTTARIRSTYERVFEEQISPGALNHHIRNITSDNGENILRRLKKGVFRFNDPRMPCFIRIVNFIHFEKYFKPT